MTRAYVAGLAPRSQTYMRHHWDHAKAFIDDAELEAARRDEEARWQSAQREAGLDLISPSYVATEDMLRPLAQLPGASVGPLIRTFETNTFHRQPVITEVPRNGLRPWVDSVRLEGAWVLSLPSPYDALLRSDVQDEQSVVACLADAASYALEAGAELVRFQEPSAAYHGHQPDAEAFGALVRAVTAGHEDRCVVHFSQGDALLRPSLLEAVPCVGIGLEAGTPPAELDLQGKQLHVGIIRGESSLVEAPGHAAAAALAEATGATLYAVTNGWDLEHVPFDVAVRKLQVLASARPLEVPA